MAASSVSSLPMDSPSSADREGCALAGRDSYCVARDEVIAFDFASGRCLGAVVRFPRLNGQAVVLFP